MWLKAKLQVSAQTEESLNFMSNITVLTWMSEDLDDTEAITGYYVVYKVIT